MKLPWIRPHLLVFAGQHYYPGLAWEDFIGRAKTIEQAAELVKKNRKKLDYDGWWMVVDSRTDSVVHLRMDINREDEIVVGKSEWVNE